MAIQSPSDNVANHIDIGNGILYIADTTFSSFANAIASTKWRKVGLILGGATLEVATQKTEIRSGVPQRIVKTFYTQQDTRMSGTMGEFNGLNFAFATGGKLSSLTITTKATAPSPTTVISGTPSTSSKVYVTSPTGFEADKWIKVGTSQYGVIQTIGDDGDDYFELYDVLHPSGTAPSAGDAVAEVDTIKYNFGAIAAPAQVALKFVKTHVGTGETITIYVLAAEADANLSLNFADGSVGGGGGVEPVGIPFSFDFLSRSNVESGATAQMIVTQA